MSVEQVPKDQEVQKVEEGGLDATGIEEKMVMWGKREQWVNRGRMAIWVSKARGEFLEQVAIEDNKVCLVSKVRWEMWVRRVLLVRWVPQEHQVVWDLKALVAIGALPVTLATLVRRGIRVLRDPKEIMENWENKDQRVEKEPRVQWVTSDHKVNRESKGLRESRVPQGIPGQQDHKEALVQRDSPVKQDPREIKENRVKQVFKGAQGHQVQPEEMVARVGKALLVFQVTQD